MSIETELQERIGRLQTAFSAANTAITGKGGTAADDISGLADAITSIPQGGESIEHTSGTFIKENNWYSRFNIEHGLSQVPKLFVFRRTDWQEETTTTYNLYAIATPEWRAIFKGTSLAGGGTPWVSVTNVVGRNNFTNLDLTEDKAIFGTANYNWKAGTYEWEAWTW